ncbi:MAG TPA: P-type conjugative transfer protein TrbG [Candidatus Binataceae bacterium]|nr:P-type conjugative transfer protein TrbG [Candidatus Binataceae bacterium]
MRDKIAAIGIALAFGLGGCASQQSPPPPVTLVAHAAPKAETAPAPVTGANLLAEQPLEVRQAVADHKSTDDWPSYKTPAYVLYPYGKVAEPLIDCAPLRTTDMQLEPGETITDVALGDSERWMVTPASSGDPRNPTPHLAVKPKAAGIATNLTIYTTRHIYHLILRSRPGREMQEVEFYYPVDLLAAMAQADQQAKQETEDAKTDDPAVAPLASLDPGVLNFSYKVAGPNVPWKPVRAFDDGSHVYIQMPTGMKSSEAPALLIAAGDGNEMVNYRVRGDYYVVDRLFDQAVLVSGVGRAQDRIQIAYTGAAR